MDNNNCNSNVPWGTPAPDDFYSYEDAVKWVEEFNRLLEEMGITLEDNSALHAAVYTYEMLDAVSNMASAEGTDIRNDVRNALGLHDLARKILAVKNHPNLSTLKPHLELLNSSPFAQNMPLEKRDSGNDKLFELYTGVLPMCFTNNVRLEDPISSGKGQNPDVLFDWNDRTWGIACKMMNTKNERTFLDNLKKGVQQIESSHAEVGIVTFNLKNVLNHDLFWGAEEVDDGNGKEIEYTCFSSPEYAMCFLIKEAKSLEQNYLIPEAKDELAEIFNGKKALPACMYFVQTTCAIGGLGPNAGPVFSTLGIFNIVPFGSIDEDAFLLLDKLNDKMHNR